MVQEFDDDGSGLIEFEEFLVLMAKKVRSCALSFFDRSSSTTLPLHVCKIKVKVKNTDSKC